MTPETLNNEVLAILDAYPNLIGLPVVENDFPIGLINRNIFMQSMARPFHREVFIGKSCIAFMDKQPLIVDKTTSIQDLSVQVLESGQKVMNDGFIVTDNGRYFGIGTAQDMLQAVAVLQAERNWLVKESIDYAKVTQRSHSRLSREVMQRTLADHFLICELYYHAHYDSLTGIPNRMLLGDRLDQACRDAEDKENLVALLFIDVDRFKLINDSLGHSAGDEVLRKIVERLKISARHADTVARLGGDEFVILMEVTDPADVEMVAQRLVLSMQEPIEFLGHSLVVTVSVGSAIYPADDTHISTLLAKADTAMYEVKASGCNGYRKYSPDTVKCNPANMMMENDLRQAIERDALALS